MLVYRVVEILCMIAILLCIRMIYMQRTYGEEAVKNLPYAVLEITGGSMEPKLSQGDGIFVYEVPFDTLEVGDTIVFWQDGDLITHQIIEVEKGLLTTQGTANAQPDEPITEEDYRAKVIGEVPIFRVISVFFQNQVYMILFLILLFLLIFGVDIFSASYDYIEGKRQKKGEK